MTAAIAVSPIHETYQRARIALAPGRRERLTPRQRRACVSLLEYCKIERYGTASPTPGRRTQFSHGAGTKQLEMVRAFRYGRHMPVPGPATPDPVADELRRHGFDKFDIIAAGGANRSGKTVSLWDLCFAQHIRDHANDGDLYWAIAPDFTKLRQGPHKWLWESLPQAMFMGRSYSEARGLGTNPILALELPPRPGETDPRGRCTIVFKTEEQKLESFESDSVHGIAWTEATRESVYDAITSRVIDTDGFILIDYLPDEPWHDERFRNSLDVFYRNFCMMDNAHNLPYGAIAKARRRMNKDEAAVRIDGKSRASYGVVVKEFRNDYFKRDDPDSGHLVKPFKIPKQWPKWVRTDVGKYTASLLLTVAPSGRWYVVDEAYTVGENVTNNAEAIDSMLDRNGLERDDIQGGGGGAPPWAMDPAAWNYTAANDKNLGELYEDEGLPYEPWLRTAKIGETAMLDKMRTEFQSWQIMVFDRCLNLRRELGSWRHKTDRDGKIDPKDMYTGDNHAIDALKSWVCEEPSYADAPGLPALAPDEYDVMRPAIGYSDGEPDAFRASGSGQDRGTDAPATPDRGGELGPAYPDIQASPYTGGDDTEW